MHKIIKFIHLPAEEKNLFFKAVRISLWVRLLILLLPSVKLQKLLGTPHKESSQAIEKTVESVAIKIYRNMRRSSVYLPFSEKCLVDAIVAKKMLQKYNIESTLYLGVAKDENKKLIAHAWLRYGNTFIVGKKGIGKFVQVEWYT
jgi:Transglutaminase-like superfamily